MANIHFDLEKNDVNLKPLSLDLTIIIVSYNTRALIIQCIESIYRYAEDVSLQILISDNASTDDTVQIVKQRFPQVVILQNEKNLGFSAANNRALVHAQGCYILFLNPDIILLEPVFKKMIEFYKTQHDAGLLGCKLINSDGSIQQSFFTNFPTLANRFLDAIYIETLLDKTLGRETGGRIKVAAVAGACMFMERKVVQKIGGFDESFFMYCEDIDLSYRISQLGYAVYFLGDLAMLHHQGASSKNRHNYFEKVLTKESVFKYFLKHKGKTKAALYKISMVFGSLFRLALLLFYIPFSKALGKHHGFSNCHSIPQYVRVCLWGLGFENWTKNPG